MPIFVHHGHGLDESIVLELITKLTVLAAALVGLYKVTIARPERGGSASGPSWVGEELRPVLNLISVFAVAFLPMIFMLLFMKFMGSMFSSSKPKPPATPVVQPAGRGFKAIDSVAQFVNPSHASVLLSVRLAMAASVGDRREILLFNATRNALRLNELALAMEAASGLVMPENHDSLLSQVAWKFGEMRDYRSAADAIARISDPTAKDAAATRLSKLLDSAGLTPPH